MKPIACSLSEEGILFVLSQGYDARCRASVRQRRFGARPDRIHQVQDHARAEESRTVDMVIGMSESRDICQSLLEKYQDRHLADRVFELAWTHSQVVLRQLNATEADAQVYGRLASSVIYATAALRAGSIASHATTAAASRGFGAIRHLRRFAHRAAANRRRGQTSISCASSCRHMPIGD